MQLPKKRWLRGFCPRAVDMYDIRVSLLDRPEAKRMFFGVNITRRGVLQDSTIGSLNYSDLEKNDGQ